MGSFKSEDLTDLTPGTKPAREVHFQGKEVRK